MSATVTTTTGSSNDTTYLSSGVWKGQTVWVIEPLWNEDGPCGGHELLLMTYFGTPTGGLYCWRCCGFTVNLGLAQGYWS